MTKFDENDAKEGDFAFGSALNVAKFILTANVFSGWTTIHAAIPETPAVTKLIQSGSGFGFEFVVDILMLVLQNLIGMNKICGK